MAFKPILVKSHEPALNIGSHFIESQTKALEERTFHFNKK
jgi:hypothetical protein